MYSIIAATASVVAQTRNVFTNFADRLMELAHHRMIGAPSADIV